MRSFPQPHRLTVLAIVAVTFFMIEGACGSHFANEESHAAVPGPHHLPTAHREAREDEREMDAASASFLGALDSSALTSRLSSRVFQGFRAFRARRLSRKLTRKLKKTASNVVASVKKVASKVLPKKAAPVATNNKAPSPPGKEARSNLKPTTNTTCWKFDDNLDECEKDHPECMTICKRLSVSIGGSIDEAELTVCRNRRTEKDLQARETKGECRTKPLHPGGAAAIGNCKASTDANPRKCCHNKWNDAATCNGDCALVLHGHDDQLMGCTTYKKKGTKDSDCRENRFDPGYGNNCIERLVVNQCAGEFCTNHQHCESQLCKKKLPFLGGKCSPCSVLGCPFQGKRKWLVAWSFRRVRSKMEKFIKLIERGKDSKWRLLRLFNKAKKYVEWRAARMDVVNTFWDNIGRLTRNWLTKQLGGMKAKSTANPCSKEQLEFDPRLCTSKGKQWFETEEFREYLGLGPVSNAPVCRLHCWPKQDLPKQGDYLGDSTGLAGVMKSGVKNGEAICSVSKKFIDVSSGEQCLENLCCHSGECKSAACNQKRDNKNKQFKAVPCTTNSKSIMDKCRSRECPTVGPIPTKSAPAAATAAATAVAHVSPVAVAAVSVAAQRPQKIVTTLTIVATGNDWSKQLARNASDKAWCRCVSKDNMKGISVCNTGCGSPDKVCSTSFGCGMRERRCDRKKCTCKPQSVRSNDMTFDQCSGECKRAGMRIPIDETGLKAALNTGCNINGRPMWVDVRGDGGGGRRKLLGQSTSLQTGAERAIGRAQSKSVVWTASAVEIKGTTQRLISKKTLEAKIASGVILYDVQDANLKPPGSGFEFTANMATEGSKTYPKTYLDVGICEVGWSTLDENNNPKRESRYMYFQLQSADGKKFTADVEVTYGTSQGEAIRMKFKEGSDKEITTIKKGCCRFFNFTITEIRKQMGKNKDGPQPQPPIPTSAPSGCDENELKSSLFLEESEWAAHERRATADMKAYTSGGAGGC